ncbi:MBL fold metallo-hydrolase [Eggerthella sinensis]|uniref:Metallo-beta-lactamase domain-containing protein n=1 Tax=Eggerthella sinensis TaxID=242230 RepID=A0A3N0IVI2_9ACTN|nr:MBL fold metallo-hydrolase [Eggerthella sinensis]RDB68641.1 hypothetical protein C1876_09315 [Eggerthella sinensis]RNM40686.1 hypothetical protein DMP09_13170 [Eggerthella sinensis]
MPAPVAQQSRSTAPACAWGSARVSPRARIVLADNPSPLTYLGTNTWVLAEPDAAACVVVDPGPDSTAHLRAVQHACAEDGREVAAILLTHDHADHAEGAERFSAWTGAPVLSRKDGTLPDGPLALGQGAPQLEVVLLPGHASDLVGFLYPADASVITGDMLFRQSSTLICWPDGSLADYFASLERLRAVVEERGVARLLTAHGPLIDDPLGAIDRAYRHRLERLEHVRAAVEGGAGRDLDRIIDAVYRDVDARLDPAARINIRSQLDYLEQRELLSS